MKRRKRYTPKQKAAIVLEVLCEERSITQIASEYGIHPNLIYKWKKEGLENFHEVYEDHKQEKRVMFLSRNGIFKQIRELLTDVFYLAIFLPMADFGKKNKAMGHQLATIHPYHPLLSCLSYAFLQETFQKV